jgi:integrase
MRNRAARLQYDNCVEGTGALAVTDCPPAPPTTCLLLGDSYCYFLVTFLSECWRRLVLAHSPNLDPGVVRATNPDIAVTVIAERFLVAVPDEADGPTMREREEEKRAYDRTRYPLLYWYWPSLMSAAPVEAIRARLLREGRTRDAALVSLIAYTGLRPAEAMALRWSAVGEDSIAAEPLPRRAAAGAGVRHVPLWKPVADDLEAWRRESGGEGRRLVFSAPSQPWAVNLQEWRERTYPELARDAGLEDLTVGYLRNAFCVLLIDAGESLERIAELTDTDVAEIEQSFGMLVSGRRSRPVSPESAIAKARAEACPGAFL